MSEVSLFTALLAGLLSFLSPCVLPLVPGYLGRLVSLARGESATLHALLFVSGFSALFTLLGVGAGHTRDGPRAQRDGLCQVALPHFLPIPPLLPIPIPCKKSRY